MSRLPVSSLLFLILGLATPAPAGDWFVGPATYGVSGAYADGLAGTKPDKRADMSTS